jgi:hypothetical protein
MRLFSGSIAASLLVMLVTGCNTVSPDECWPNTSGGLGGSGTIPIGAGVGATSGGDSDSPPPNGETPNPCVTPSDKSDPPKSDAPVEASLKVFCSKPDHGATCSERCMNKALPCVALAVHPYKSDGGIGKLFSCNDPLFGTMCGYHYPNGDDCYYYFGFPHPPFCSYSGND